MGETFGVDSGSLEFNSTLGTAGIFFSLPNHSETVGCTNQIKANAATMVRANLSWEGCFVLRLKVKFFQKAKNYLLENLPKSSRF